MYQMLRLPILVMAVVFANLPTKAPARVAVTQIKLTEKHVEEFIAAQKDMSAVVEKMMQGAVFSSSANARYEAEGVDLSTGRHNAFRYPFVLIGTVPIRTCCMQWILHSSPV